MRKNNLRNKPLGTFEQLETRLPLAGNVTVAVDQNGTLRVTGDSLGNGVTIQGLGNPGEFGVFGFDADGAATSINGTPNAVAYVKNVTSIASFLYDGSDTLFFWNFNSYRYVDIDAGYGDYDVVYGGLPNQQTLFSQLEISEAENVNLQKIDCSGSANISMDFYSE